MADIHGVHETYSWLRDIAFARRPEAVVLAGDLLGGGSDSDPIEVAHASQAQIIADFLAGFECPVLTIMGNDDMAPLPERPGRVIPIHGSRWEAPRFNFVGYQYSLPFMAGIFEKPEDEIEADLEQLAPMVDASTVLVTHNPAFGILDIGILGRQAGSTSIMRLIEERRPRAHIHGHIHQAAGRQGRHFNVAAAGRRRAVLLDLEKLADEILIGAE